MLEQLIHVLVVEDNPGDAERTCEDVLELAPRGSTVVVAMTLADALAQTRGRAFDVVITDLGVPDSRGLDTLLALRRACPAAPVIVLTGLDEDELGLEAVRHGAADYLPKSQCNGRVLLRAIGYALERLRRKRAESDLHRAQKLEAINRLAAGVAHHFNNLLTVVIGNAFLLKDTVDGTPGSPHLSEVIEAADRARVLAGHLVTFCERRRFDGSEDVNAIVRDVEATLRDALGRRIELVMDLAEETRPVAMDRMGIEQALIILALNGRDAMPEGGRLTVSTRVGPDPEAPHARPRREFVVLTVADEGRGIAPHVAERLFEPFFTTKEVGAGVGLGLSVVHALVQRAGGVVRVCARPAGGTALSLCLPPKGDEPAPPASREMLD